MTSSAYLGLPPQPCYGKCWQTVLRLFRGYIVINCASHAWLCFRVVQRDELNRVKKAITYLLLQDRAKQEIRKDCLSSVQQSFLRIYIQSFFFFFGFCVFCSICPGFPSFPIIKSWQLHCKPRPKYQKPLWSMQLSSLMQPR